MWKCNRHDWRVKVIHRYRVPSAPLGKKARCSPGVWHGVICVNTLLCVCTNTYIYANRCTTFYIFLREKVHLFPIPELPCDKLWPMTCSWIDTVYVPGLRFKGSVSSALVLLLVWPHHLKKPHTHTHRHTTTLILLWKETRSQLQVPLEVRPFQIFQPYLSSWWRQTVSDSQRHSRKPPGDASPAQVAKAQNHV